MYEPVSSMAQPVGDRRAESISLVTHPTQHLSSCRLTWSPHMSTSFGSSNVEHAPSGVCPFESFECRQEVKYCGGAPRLLSFIFVNIIRM